MPKKNRQRQQQPQQNRPQRSSIEGVSIQEERKCLAEIRKEGPNISPYKILSNGQKAGDFALNYVLGQHSKRLEKSTRNNNNNNNNNNPKEITSILSNSNNKKQTLLYASPHHHHHHHANYFVINDFSAKDDYNIDQLLETNIVYESDYLMPSASTTSTITTQ